MELRPLGGTGLSVSEVILGCGSIGGIGSAPSTRGRGLSVEDGLRQIDEAVALGVRTLDTADAYAGGVSEQVVGQWLAAHPDADVLVATKVGNKVRPEQAGVLLSPDHIAAQVEASLARLGRIDLYLSHAPDPTTPVEQTLEAFAAVLESGQARAIGGCHLDVRSLEHVLVTADRLGLPAYSWVQNEYNLLAREDEADLFAMLRERGIGYTPFSAHAGGVLAGRYRRGEPVPAGSRLDVLPAVIRDLDGLWDGLNRLALAADSRGVSMAALSLAWVLSSPAVAGAIAAPRPGQFGDVAAALEIELSEDERAELASLFAG